MKHRPLRTVLSALLIAIPVTLVLTLAGLSKGMIEDYAKRTRGFGADIMVRPKSSTFTSLGSSPIPEALVGFVQKRAHVTVATGIVAQSLGSPTSSVAGIDLSAFNQMSGGLEYVSGGPFHGPNEMIVDEFFAKEKKIRVGDSTALWDPKHQWKVTGIVKPGKLNRVFVDLKELQELVGATGHVSLIYVKVDDPKNIPAVTADLKSQLPDYPIYPIEEFTSLISYDTIPLLSRFTNVVVGIAIFIGFAVVCLSMYMAVLQRTREIGILKALGASRWYVISTILREAVLLSVVGTLFGIAMSYAVKWALETFVPATLPPAVDPAWWPWAALIALTGAVLGALYPGMRAAAMDPIEALSYE